MRGVVCTQTSNEQQLIGLAVLWCGGESVEAWDGFAEVTAADAAQPER